MKALAVVALLVLAPVSVDVVFGATPVTVPFALVPETLTYGVAAVLIRELAVARRRGAATAVLLGTAFAVLSECLVVQTSVAPGTHDVGRAAGVTWPYLTFMVGYIAVWAVLVPITVVDAGAGTRPWLGWWGRIGFGLLFVVGCLVAWFQWTRVVRPTFEGLPVYDPPASTAVVAALAVVAIVGLALAGPRLRRLRPGPRRPPHPALVGLVPVPALGLVAAGTIAAPEWLPPPLGIALAVVVALCVAGLFAAWVRGPGWSVAHRLAGVAGAFVANFALGLVVVADHAPVDVAGRAVVLLVVLAAVAWVARRAGSDREPAAAPA